MNNIDYKVNHLFLLIGENPLPNYVAARLLLKQGGTPYLVYTTDTEKTAERLQDILNNDENIDSQPAQFVPLNDYESDAHHIQTEIAKKLEKLQGKIGLNYTGGTKAMSVHSYRALFYKIIDPKKQLYTKRSDVFFSYLDPRRLEMCIDNENGERIRIKVKPDDLQLELKDLFKIHGLKLCCEPIDQSILPKLATKLAEIFKNKENYQKWLKWLFEEFYEQARKKKSNNQWGDWQSKTKLLNISVSVENLPQEFIEAFQQENFLAPDGKLSLQKVKETGIFPKIEDFCKWLNGIWLEHYVLAQIQTIANSDENKNKSLIYDYGMSFKVPLTGTQDGFEFDIAFTHGYQIFAISCTTDSSRELCKTKLFEAYMRAQQMGGAEARVALVCCNDDPISLKAEISSTLADKKIAVFGRNDLPDLKISDWIKDNDRESKK